MKAMKTVVQITLELPVKIGSIIGPLAYMGHAQPVYLRTGMDGWQQTGKEGYLGNAEMERLVRRGFQNNEEWVIVHDESE